MNEQDTGGKTGHVDLNKQPAQPGGDGDTKQQQQDQGTDKGEEQGDQNAKFKQDQQQK